MFLTILTPIIMHCRAALSFMQYVVPDQMKIAKVIPKEIFFILLCKKMEREFKCNYFPMFCGVFFCFFWGGGGGGGGPL